MKKIIGLLFSVLLMMSGMAAAEEKEPGFWVDPNYDFSQVHRVCVLEPEFTNDVKKEDYGELKKLFLKNARLRNVKIVTMNEVLDQIKKDSGKDARKMDSQDGWKLFLEQVPKYADLMIDAKILRCGVIIRDSPKETIRVLHEGDVDNEKPIYGYNGAKSTDYGIVGYERKEAYWVNERVSGGRGEPLLAAKIDWNVYDLRTNKAVIVSTQEGSVPMKIGSGEYGLGGLDLSKRMPGFTPQRICEMTIQSFFGELSTRINGQ